MFSNVAWQVTNIDRPRKSTTHCLQMLEQSKQVTADMNKRKQINTGPKFTAIDKKISTQKAICLASTFRRDGKTNIYMKQTK